MVRKCVITNSVRGITFTIIHAKLYTPIVNLTTKDNSKLLQQLKSGFKRMINWNKYQSKVTTETRNEYLDYLVDQNFEGISKIFVLRFWNKTR